MPGEFQPSPDGSDIRFVLGSVQTMTGRIFVPGRGLDEADVDIGLSGEWRYDSGLQELTVTFDPSVPISPPQIVFQLSFLSDRVRLEAEVDIDGVPLRLDLGKPLPPEDAPTSNCANCPAFNVVPAR